MRPIRIAFVVALGLVPLAAVAQQQRAAIASSDVLSQISMFNYQGKSSLELRPTPIVSTGGGQVDVDYKDGNARIEVRGLRASIRRSAMRLKAIAAERAPTIATTIQKNCFNVGSPFAPSTAPRSANGNAKSVCSILIISRVVRVLLITVDTVGLSAVSFSSMRLLLSSIHTHN